MSKDKGITGQFDWMVARDPFHHSHRDGMVMGRNVFGLVALACIIGAGVFLPALLTSVVFWIVVALASVGLGLVAARRSKIALGNGHLDASETRRQHQERQAEQIARAKAPRDFEGGKAP